MSGRFYDGIKRPERMYSAERRWARDLPVRYQDDLTRRRVSNLVARIAGDYNRPTPTIRWTGRRGGASASTYRIMFTHNSKRQATPTWLVCHEMAHALAPVSSTHDHVWLRYYGQLVETHIGPKAATQLVLLLGAELPD